MVQMLRRVQEALDWIPPEYRPDADLAAVPCTKIEGVAGFCPSFYLQPRVVTDSLRTTSPTACWAVKPCCELCSNLWIEPEPGFPRMGWSVSTEPPVPALCDQGRRCWSIIGNFTFDRSTYRRDRRNWCGARCRLPNGRQIFRHR